MSFFIASSQESRLLWIVFVLTNSTESQRSARWTDYARFFSVFVLDSFSEIKMTLKASNRNNSNFKLWPYFLSSRSYHIRRTRCIRSHTHTRTRRCGWRPDCMLLPDKYYTLTFSHFVGLFSEFRWRQECWKHPKSRRTGVRQTVSCSINYFHLFPSFIWIFPCVRLSTRMQIERNNWRAIELTWKKQCAECKWR